MTFVSIYETHTYDNKTGQAIPINKKTEPQKKEEKLEFSKSISGVELVNEDFYLNIQKGITFSKFEFYTAKPNNCQWYGIINNYDVKRKILPDITNIAKASFEDDISFPFVVRGDDGSGKSTLLRRLAIDLRSEDFYVLWLKEDGFNVLT